ncbi:MAG: hypothetical protein M1826_003095 [Phylliscum demangeonii]|nr:MAG: hypothetical protein M1826_003095 [Phylliscum demangeonii]
METNAQSRQEVGDAEKANDPANARTREREPGPPPDGGRAAWTQAVISHLVVLNTWGYINSYGVFQSYYVETLGHPPSDIAWVGSTQIFLIFFVGTFSGRATDAGLFRPTFLAGSVLVLVGIFMTSLTTRYWQLFLSQGVCMGLGNGLLFCPSISLLSTYFSRKRALAIAIAACGSATGGTIFPAIVQQLLPRIGFPWTVRVLAFVSLAIAVVTNVFSRPRLPPRRSGPLIEWAAFKEAPYVLFSLGMFLILWGLYIAFYFIGSFGRDVLHLSRSASISLILIMNGVGLFGRLIPNHYGGDRWLGPLNTLITVVAAGAVLLYGWMGVHSPAGLVAFAVCYGFVAGGIQSLFPATISSLTPDPAHAGVRMGMVFSLVSFACLTGPPIAGALIQRDQGRYRGAQLFAASALAAGGLVLVAARVALTGRVLRRKV